MQYVLTEDEKASLVSKDSRDAVVEQLIALRRIIISDEACEAQHYCDDCHVQKVTPSKGWNDERINPCPRTRRYPK